MSIKGEWGGESQSDIAVRVLERNKECIRVIQRFITDATNKPSDGVETSRLVSSLDITESINNKAFKIAVLYGVYHIDDLKTRIVNELGLQSVPVPTSTSSIAAWTIPLPSSVMTATATTSSNSKTTDALPSELKSALEMTPTSASSSDTLQLKPETVAIMALLSLGYLVLGTFDWIVLVKVALEVFTQTAVTAHWGPGPTPDQVETAKTAATVITQQQMNILSGMSSVGVNTADTDYLLSSSSSSPIAFLLFFVGYYVLYVQRHLQLLRSISAFGIQWDRGLFDD